MLLAALLAMEAISIALHTYYVPYLYPSLNTPPYPNLLTTTEWVSCYLTNTGPSPRIVVQGPVYSNGAAASFASARAQSPKSTRTL